MAETTSWIDIGAEADLPVGGLAEFVVGDRIVVVVHTDRGWFALDGLCAHQGGPLAKGRIEGDCLTCPWHGWQYDVATGQQLVSSAIRQPTFPVIVEAGRIRIRIEPQ